MSLVVNKGVSMTADLSIPLNGFWARGSPHPPAMLGMAFNSIEWIRVEGGGWNNSYNHPFNSIEWIPSPAEWKPEITRTPEELSIPLNGFQTCTDACQVY